jgi:PAS domain S-box-containing protein
MDKGLRILILEDVPTDAELVERELNRAGIRFSSKRVETKEGFIEALKDFAPDTILSDYKLPNFDGMAALEITKELAPTIPFITVTGSMNEETAVECMKAGAADYVIKDHLARIGPAVEGALENKRVREEKARLEKALWTAAREWQATFDAINYPVALMDLEGRIRRSNKAMANLLGKGFTEIIERNCCEIVRGVSGPIEGCPVARLRETRRRETLVLSMNDRWFNIVADPLLDENGSLIGAVHIMFDITERKRAEEALRVSHRFIEIANRHTEMTSLLKEFMVEVRNLTHCAAVGLRLLDEDGNIPYQAYDGFSQEFYEKESPLSIKSDQCICINVIKGTRDSVLPFYTASGSFYINATTRFLATVSEEEKGKTRNECNRVGFESVALVPIRLEDQILGLIHVADSSENMVPLETVETLERVAMQLGEAIRRLKVEEALRESEKRFRNLIETTSDWVWEVDENGVYTYVSPRLRDLLGYQPEEVLGKTPFDFMPPDEAQRVGAIFGRIVAQLSPLSSLENTNRHRDGRLVVFETSGLPFFDSDGTFRGYRGIDRDITERKEAEEALRESEKRYRQVIDNATEIIYSLDIKGNLIYGNPACLKTTGFSLEELRQHNYQDLIVPEHQKRLTEIYIKQFREREAKTYEEFPFFNKSGEVVWFGQNASLVIEDGKVEGFHIIARDITEGKVAGEALKKSEERFRELYDNAPVGYFEYDSHGRITDVNRTELEMLGYSLEEMIGQPVWKFIAEEEVARQQVLAKLYNIA